MGMVKREIRKEVMETVMNHNTEILIMSNCIEKLKYGEIKENKIIWESVEDFVKETKENCPTLESIFYYFNDRKVIMLLDSKKISQKISQ